MCVPPGKPSDWLQAHGSTTLLSCCLSSAFAFYHELSILCGLSLIKLFFPFLLMSSWWVEKMTKSLQTHIFCPKTPILTR